ncbi:MAG: GNAT family N-acetyltransferase [Thermomicrobiales bacterium]|nr:GNAT family N-acetyltransferase [Thermomicrobiales bacterium]
MLNFRPGTPDDLADVLRLFDDNIEWLVARGRSAQWGSEPFSTNPQRTEFVADILTRGEFTVAEVESKVVGASVLTDHPMPYVPPVDEPERYLKLLIASPAHRGEGIGHQLIQRARARTIEEGIGLMRVDCWSGGDKRLVAYYVSQGFTPTDEIEVRQGTSVQVFEWRP